MGTTKQINIIGRTYYFSNDIIDLDKFDGALIKIDKKKFLQYRLCNKKKS